MRAVLTRMSRVAIVTGGTRGIGRAICERLRDERECKVIANYAGNDDAAKKFTEETGIPTVKFDVSDFDAVQAGCLGNDMLSRADFLGKLPMFTHYDQETLLEMAQMCIHQVFPYDQQIVEQNEELRGLYLILTGTVRRERAFDVPETIYNHVTKEWQPTGKRDRSTLDLGLLYPA